MLGQIGYLVKAAADADAQHDGGAGVGAGQTYGLDDKVLYALHAVGRLEHAETAHILAAEALGGHSESTAVSRDQADRDGGGGIVLRVHPAQGVAHDGLAEIPFAVALAHALVNGGLKVPLDVHILAQLHKYAGHAGVLADGHVGLLGQLHVVPQKAQGLLGQGPGLGLALPVQGGNDVGGQVGVGLDAQASHRFRDGGGLDGTHTHSLFLRVFSIVSKWGWHFQRRAKKSRREFRRDFRSLWEGSGVLKGSVGGADGAVSAQRAQTSQVVDGAEGVVE